jgi:SAM-dependent methyltransferase
MQPLYDAIGVTYGTTRRADPALTEALARYLGISPEGTFLDLACGTGNYTCALEMLGGRWHGIDISNEMLDQAKSKSKSVVWRHADAGALPYADRTFDGVICTLAIHHFAELSMRSVGRGSTFKALVLSISLTGFRTCFYIPARTAQSSIWMLLFAPTFHLLRRCVRRRNSNKALLRSNLISKKTAFERSRSAVPARPGTTRT